MGVNVVTKALAKKYTDESISGTSGVIAGKNCTIQSIVKSGSKNTVTFKWTADDGSTKTNTMIVNDGKSPVSATINASNHVIFTYDDGSTIDAGEMPKTKVSISKETGNALTEKTDGLYVAKGSVEISKETGNTITSKSDGLYVPATDISGKVDKVTGKGLSTNDLTDTLKAQYDKAEENVQSDWNVTDTTSDAFIKNKPTVDNTYSATSDNAQSGKAVASGIATEIGKLTYLSKKIATKAEIDEYVADATKASFNVIYLLKDTSVSGKDKYFEYQRLGDNTSSSFEMTGDTSTDLSDYVKKEDGKGLSTNDYDNTAKTKVAAVHCDIGSVRVGEIEDTSLGKHSHIMGFTSSSKSDPVVRYINYKEDGKSSQERLLFTYESSTDDFIVKGDANGKSKTFKWSDKADKTVIDDNAEYLKTKNLLDKTNTIKNYWYNTTTGEYIKYPTSGVVEVTGKIAVEKGNYYLSGVSQEIRCYKWKADGTYYGTKLLEAPCGISVESDGYIAIIFEYGTDLSEAQMEKGDVATSYTPYGKSNVEITEKISALSNENDDLKMLGWTVPSECPIQNYTDANGVFHQRVGRVDLGSLSWTLFKSDLNIFSASIVGIQNTKYAQMYSNIYNLANNKSVSEFENLDMRSSGNSAVVFIRNTSYSDADAFKSAMNGVYLYYELATEITKSVDGNEKLAEIGTTKSVSKSSQTISVNSSSEGRSPVKICELELEKGVWVIELHAQASTNLAIPVNMYFGKGITTSPGNGNLDYYGTVWGGAAYSVLRTTRVMNITENGKYEFGLCGVGSGSFTVSYYGVRAVKISQ